MDKKEVGKLLGINTREYDILSINEFKQDEKTYMDIYIDKKNKKAICPTCGLVSVSKRDILKYSFINHGYVKFYHCRLVFRKQRYFCKQCKKKFIEEYDIVNKHAKTSNLLRIEIRKKLLNINLTLKEIANQCGVSDTDIKDELIEIMSDYPKIKSLKGVKVLSFDEYAADTELGKYACILNDPINKKTLDILETRKKDYLKNYFKDVEDRDSVEYVVSDMYDIYLSITKQLFKNAKYVVDRFHYVRCIQQTLSAT